MTASVYIEVARAVIAGPRGNRDVLQELHPTRAREGCSNGICSSCPRGFMGFIISARAFLDRVPHPGEH